MELGVLGKVGRHVMPDTVGTSEEGDIVVVIAYCQGEQPDAVKDVTYILAPRTVLLNQKTAMVVDLILIISRLLDLGTTPDTRIIQYQHLLLILIILAVTAPAIYVSQHHASCICTLPS